MRARSQDLGFRLTTGAFAALAVVLVAGIGAALVSQSWLAVQKFGLGFWTSRIWDPVAGDFGAFPFIWGTLYSSVLALILFVIVELFVAEHPVVDLRLFAGRNFTLGVLTLSLAYMLFFGNVVCCRYGCSSAAWTKTISLVVEASIPKASAASWPRRSARIARPMRLSSRCTAPLDRSPAISILET